MNWSIDKLVRKGWKLILPPDIVKQSVAQSCGFQPKDRDETTKHIYNLEETDSCLTGTVS